MGPFYGTPKTTRLWRILSVVQFALLPGAWLGWVFYRYKYPFYHCCTLPNLLFSLTCIPAGVETGLLKKLTVGTQSTRTKNGFGKRTSRHLHLKLKSNNSNFRLGPSKRYISRSKRYGTTKGDGALHGRLFVLERRSRNRRTHAQYPQRNSKVLAPKANELLDLLFWKPTRPICYATFVIPVHFIFEI
jgi:hypothetical protein